ncbi:hypothetical protein TNCV_87601 [Trichonephila clavipes]|nr:hypothetical protein TNCV_87601 [Trichonephila clavipes]
MFYRFKIRKLPGTVHTMNILFKKIISNVNSLGPAIIVYKRQVRACITFLSEKPLIDKNIFSKELSSVTIRIIGMQCCVPTQHEGTLDKNSSATKLESYIGGKKASST